jgi:hypothetical protein
MRFLPRAYASPRREVKFSLLILLSAHFGVRRCGQAQ